MRVLLTGFEPFGGSTINPSQEVVRAIEAARGLAKWPARLELSTRILPVEARRGPATLLKAIDQIRPRAIVCLGESARAAAITIERIFINLADYSIADNAGTTLINKPIIRNGPAAYFSTLPVETLHKAVERSATPVQFSLSAGAFLCNHVAYAMLHHLRRTRRSVPAGFVHLPRLPQQPGRMIGGASMELDQMVRAVMAMLTVLAAPRRTGSRRRTQKR
jgi:pyroglutamyl-peptidase